MSLKYEPPNQAARANMTIEVPIAFGLILPSAGFSSESLLVSTDAVDGPVLNPTPHTLHPTT
jgi:hypothetical protein